jgi:hypothetical protein
MVEQQAAPLEAWAAEKLAEEPAKEPENSWFSNHTTPWEIDAQKATALASTWDVPPVAEPVVAESAATEFVSSDVAIPSSAEVTETYESSVRHVDETQEVPVEHEMESGSPSAAIAEPRIAPAAEEPNVDELVARVLAKMSPDVLQKVTRELLKPMIETIVRDEISGKK